MMLKYILLLTSMSLAIVGQISFKHGLNNVTISPHLAIVLKVIFTPYVFIGFMCYGISSIIWLFVLEKFPLSVAYPALALSYVLIVLFSFLILKEPLTVNKVIGSCIIVTGVFVLFK